MVSGFYRLLSSRDDSLGWLAPRQVACVASEQRSHRLMLSLHDTNAWFQRTRAVELSQATTEAELKG